MIADCVVDVFVVEVSAVVAIVAAVVDVVAVHWANVCLL